jgi:hypothetical protein
MLLYSQHKRENTNRGAIFIEFSVAQLYHQPDRLKIDDSSTWISPSTWIGKLPEIFREKFCIGGIFFSETKYFVIFEVQSYICILVDSDKLFLLPLIAILDLTSRIR